MLRFIFVNLLKSRDKLFSSGKFNSILVILLYDKSKKVKFSGNVKSSGICEIALWEKDNILNFLKHCINFGISTKLLFAKSMTLKKNNELKELNVVFEKECKYGVEIIASYEVREYNDELIILHKIENNEGTELSILKSKWSKVRNYTV